MKTDLIIIKAFKTWGSFNEFSNERTVEIYKISKKNWFNNLTYRFKGPNLAPTNSIDFRGPIHFYNEINKS